MHKIFAKTLFLGKNIIYLPECHSTNQIAAELVNNQSVSEGTLVITDRQTKGKGQRGNSWEAQPRKNLTFTLILKPSFLKIIEQFNMTLVISNALKDVFDTFLPENKVHIKWPNDLYVDNRKCAGILIENGIKGSKIDYMLVGVGINVNQKVFSVLNATSLFSFLGKEVSLRELLENVLLAIEKHYLSLKQGKGQVLRRLYLENLYWKDEWHLFSDGDETFFGRIVGVDPIGRIVIEAEGGQRCYDVKEVSFEK